MQYVHVKRVCVILIGAVVVHVFLFINYYAGGRDYLAVSDNHYDIDGAESWPGTLKNSSVIRYQPLPLSVVNGIKTYLFFIGIARSGHSIVAALLDSHPHIVIADELDVFNTVLSGHDLKVDKSLLFNQVWNMSYEKAVTTDATVNIHDTRKGYSLAIDGLYQGTYQSHIDVIGDKSGGTTVKMFLTNPQLFESCLNKLRSLDNLHIKVLHVIRNPFDNIATIAIYRHFKYGRTKVAMLKNSSNKTIRASAELINKVIEYYFTLYKASEVMRQQFNLDMMDVHSKELIDSPKAIINEMCAFLQISCSDNYINAVSRKIFHEESKTRHKLKWTNDQILKVKENILEFDSLKQYLNFNS